MAWATARQLALVPPEPATVAVAGSYARPLPAHALVHEPPLAPTTQHAPRTVTPGHGKQPAVSKTHPALQPSLPKGFAPPLALVHVCPPSVPKSQLSPGSIVPLPQVSGGGSPPPASAVATSWLSVSI